MSLPVGLNEPVTILQKCCEILGNYDLIEGAAGNNQKSKEEKDEEADEMKNEMDAFLFGLDSGEVKENEKKEETKVEENTEQGPPETNGAEVDTPEDSCKRLV